MSTYYLSDLPWLGAAVSGWGPVERDSSNGEDQAGDGNPISIAGIAYAKGLGAHSWSAINYDLRGACTNLKASVGIDDEIGLLGSVRFYVYVDGKQAYRSELATGGRTGPNGRCRFPPVLRCSSW